MSKTRQKKTLITQPMTLQDAEFEFAQYADSDARIQKISAQMDVEITRIRKKYDDELSVLEDLRKNAFEKLQHFATNTPEFFTKKKSLEFTHGVIGFRTATPSLKPLKGFTWAAVLNMVKNALPQYVRMKEEVDKERLLADREDETVASKFRTIGVQVVQEETFFVAPKKEETAAV